MKDKLILELEKEAERLHNSTRTDLPFLSPVHNYLRSKSNLYYHWSTNTTTSSIHKIGAIAFMASFVFFLGLQALFPDYFSGVPGIGKGVSFKLEEPKTREATWNQYKNTRAQMKDVVVSPDGKTATAKVYTHPVQYLDTDSQWKDIDTNIKTSIGGQDVLATAVSGQKNKPLFVKEAPYKSYFSTNLASDLKIDTDGEYLINSFIDAGDNGALIEKNKATYQDVYPKTDVERIFKDSELKQNIVLKEPGHPIEFKEKIESSLRIQIEKDNSLVYFKGGKKIASTPPIKIVDADGYEEKVNLRLEENVLTISLPNTRFLAYPIIIDPTTSIYGASGDDTYVQDTDDGYGNHTYTSYPYLTSLPTAGGQKSYLRFSFAGIVRPTSATLNLYKSSGSGTTVLKHSNAMNPGTDAGLTLWNTTTKNDISTFTPNTGSYTPITVTTDVQEDFDTGSYAYFQLQPGTGGESYYSANYSTYSNHLRSVYFADANTGYAVGDSGTILKTTDAGSSWSALTSGTTQPLYGVYFTNANTGYAVGGSGGLILKTTDAGSSWTPLNDVMGSYIFGVYFTDANTGYVVGGSGAISKTTDAGSSWTFLTSGTSQYLQGIYFTDANTGYTVGSGGTIFKTTNAGANWAGISSGTSSYLQSIYFTDANTGYAVGSGGAISKTTNAGANWSVLTSGTSADFQGVYFTDANTGYVVGINGTIRKTTNAGANWSALISSTNNKLNGLYFTNSNTGYAVGENYTIQKTTNAGSEWSIFPDVSRDPYLSITYPNVPMAPTGFGGSALSTSSIRWTWTDASSDETGFRVHDASQANKSGDLAAGTQQWDEGSLAPNTSYVRHAHSFGAEGESVSSNTATKYTLPATPSVSTTSGKVPNDWINSAQTFQNNNTFGAGGVQYYRYVWDTSATHTWTDTETQWSASTISPAISETGAYYLHLKSYNGENVANGTIDYGPFSVDKTPPTITSFSLNNGGGYANGVVTGNGIFNDTGGSSGTLQVQFSEDATNWGTYPGSGTSNQTDGTNWTYYKTVTAGAGSQEIVNAWYLSGDGTKTVYARTRDGAWNVSGKIFSSQAEWQSATLTNIDTTSESGSAKMALGWMPYQTVDTATNYYSNSIVLDSNRKVHIAYVDDINKNIKYATNASGSWVSSILYTVGGISAPSGVSLALDSSNGVHVLYTAIYASNNVTLMLDGNSLDEAPQFELYAQSLAIDSNNKFHISYYDAQNLDLRYATNASGSWVYTALDSTGSVGGYSSIALDSNNKVHISYFDDTNDDLKYATDSSGSWVTSTLDSSGGVGVNPTIAIDSNNKIYIVYCTTGGILKYATNASGSWVYAQPGIISVNPASRDFSMALDSNDKVHISYFNGSLRYTTNASGSWVNTSIATVGNGANMDATSIIMGPYNKSRRDITGYNTPNVTSGHLSGGGIYYIAKGYVNGSIGGTGTGLRVGNPANSDLYKWLNLKWNASGLSSTYKIRLQVRPADTWGSGDTGYVNPVDGTGSWYELTSGTSGTIPLSSSFSNTKTLEVRAELVGDGNNTPVLYDLSVESGGVDSITVDTTSPNMGAITAKTASGGSVINASSWQNDNDPYFEWSAPSDTSGIAGYYYAMDNATPESGGTWTTSANVQYTDNSISDGVHTFYVRAKDNAGNQTGTVGSFIIWVDSNPPTSAVTITPIYVGPNTYTSSIINGTASDGTGSGVEKTEITIQRSSDSQYWTGTTWGASTWLNVGSGATWSYDIGTGNLGNNIQYTIISKTTDNAGSSTTSASDSFTYDNEAGSSSITFPVNDGKYNSTSWTGSVTGTASDTVSGPQKTDVRIKRNSDNYYYDGTNFVDSPDPNVRWLLATGTDTFSYAISAAKFTDSTNYTVESRATDNAGNVQGTADSKTFLFDEGAPTGTIVIANDNPYTKNTSNWMQLTAVGDTEKMKISNNADLSPDGVNGDSGTWINFATSKQWTLSTGADGTRTVYVKFRDYATNESVLTYSDAIYLDTTPATSAVTSPADNSSASLVTQIAGTATDSGSGITNASQITIAIIKNIDGTDNYWTGTGSIWDTNQNWIAVDSIGGTPESRTWTKNTVPGDFAQEIEKDFTIKVKSIDDATNAGTESQITFHFDNVLPSMPTVASSTHAVEATWYNTNNVTISNISSTDTYGIAGYSYAFTQEGTDPDENLDTPVPPNTYSGKADGIWHFKVKSRDNSGNWSLIKDFVVRIDTAGPTAGTPVFQVNGIDDTKIRLTWGKYTDPSSGVKEYKIYRSTAKTSPEADGNQTVPRPSYANLVATVPSDGSETYIYDDTGLTMGWFYYRIEAYDNATTSNMSEYAYSHSKTNFIPNAITNFTVNGGTGAVTILPSALHHNVNLAWTSTDPDGASDITTVKYIITKPDGSTVHSQANVTCPGANCTSVSNGYAVSALSVNFGNSDAYGDYTIRAQTIDTIGIGGHIVDSASVTVKLIPAGPTGIVLSSDRSSRIDINSAGSPFTAPNSGAGVVSYKIYRRTDNPSGDDATWKTGATTVYTGANQYYQDNSVEQGIMHYYRISAIDQSSNEGVLSNASSTIPPKAVAPINVKLQDVSQITTNDNDYRLFVSWDKVTAGQTPDRIGYVVSKSTDGITYDYLATINNYQTNYYLDVSVSLSSTYYYQVRTYDGSYNPVDGLIHQGLGNASGLTEPISIQPGTVDSVAPAISGVNVSAGVSTATITWNTNENADTLVKYGTTAGYGLKSGQYTVGEADSNTSHSVVLRGLTPGTTYHYNVNSRDTSKNLGESGDQTFSTGQFSIGSLSSGTPSNNGAIITWATEASGNSIVEYRAESDASFKVAGNTSENVTSHSVELTGLKNNTEYFFKVRSERDEGGDKITAQSEGISSFRTKPTASGSVSTPAVSKVNETEVTATSVTIAWDTNIPMTSWVEYGTSESYGTTLGDDNMNTHHTVKISGLVSETTYHYRIKGKDQGGNEFISPDYTFKALSLPIITGINIQKVESYSTIITWSTNIATDSGVNYGKDTNYGLRAGSNEMTTAHSLTLADLTDQTTYHFQIEVKDARGNAVKGDDKVFTTPLDTQGPKLSEIKISPLTGNDEAKRGVIITWITDKEATTQVEYGAGVTPGKYDQKSPIDPNYSTSHTIIVSDLEPGTTYHFRLVSKDKRGNEGKSQDFTMLTSDKEESILTLILKTLEDTFSWVGRIREFIGSQFGKLMGK